MQRTKRWISIFSWGNPTQHLYPVALRLLYWSVPIIITIGFGFFLFWSQLHSLLAEEKRMLYHGKALQCAQLISYQVEMGQKQLNQIEHVLAAYSFEESQAFMKQLGTEKISLASCQGQCSPLPPISLEGDQVVYRTTLASSDGIEAQLQLRMDTLVFHEIMACWAKHQGSQFYWVAEDGMIIWQFMDDALLATQGAVDAIIPHWRDAIASTLLDEETGCYLSCIRLENGLGYFLLQVPDVLLRQAGITILQAVLSLALLVVLLLFALLSYLLYRDHVYEQTLIHLAYQDELTALPNKNRFLHDAEILLRHATNKYAIIVLDIGKFKLINDHFGYAFGDSLLMHCARVLPRYTTQDGCYARLSGDKFILLSSYRERSALERRITIIIEELKRFSFPSSSAFQLDMLAGITTIEGKPLPVNTYIDQALFALSSLKGERKSGWMYYHDLLKEQLLEESELNKVFSNALQHGQFSIMLQPKYSLTTNHLVGAEALVRWNHPERGVLNPSQFIPLLEKHDLLILLDMFVLEAVCKLFKRWGSEGKPLFSISVNQSRSHLFHLDYEQHLLALVDRYEIPHTLMEFELTESVFMYDTNHLSTVLAHLRAQQFKVSLDDFGSGYSSLTMLKDIPIDVIKMDQGFLSGSEMTQRGKLVVGHSIALAKSLGITTVAEGVETEQQVSLLKELGCDVVQGYYYSEPLNISQYEQLLDDDSPRHFS